MCNDAMTGTSHRRVPEIEPNATPSRMFTGARYRRSRTPPFIRHSSFVIRHFALRSTSVPSLAADAPSLLDRPPFDQIVLNEANENARLDVVPLHIAAAAAAQSAAARASWPCNCSSARREAFEVEWSAVAQIRVYEQMLLDEARRLTAAGEFDEAYDYFVRLSNDYPNLPGLDDAVGDYLRRNAFALYQAKQNDRALALLLTLYERNPRVSGTAERRRDGRRRNHHAVSAQPAISRPPAPCSICGGSSSRESPPRPPPPGNAASKRPPSAKLDEARQLVDERQYIPARKAAEGGAGRFGPN